jgi:branched-chain amino acid transport system permease protein
MGVWLSFAIGRINIAQGGFAMIGGYTVAILAVDLGLSFWLALPAAGLVAGITGFLIGYPILRLKGVYFAMLTLSLTEAIRLVFLNADWLSRGATGLTDLPLPGAVEIFGLTLMPAFAPGARLPFYWLAAALLLGGLFLLWRIQHTRLGAVFRALRLNEELAASIGVDVARYRAIAFAISSAYGGIGGAVLTTLQQNIYPSSYQVTDSVYLMMYCFVGGLSYVIGPILGTFALVASFDLLVPLGRYQSLAYAALIIAAMLLLPNGLAGLLGGRARPENAPDVVAGRKTVT